MTKKGISLKTLIIIIGVLEIGILILSGGLNKTGQIGFENGTFVMRNVVDEYSIQEAITEEFQPDLHLEETGGVGAFYGSTRLYDFFHSIFGSSTISAFNLIRILIIVNIVILWIAFTIKKYLFERPSKPQILLEGVYEFFDGLVADSLGEERRNFTPYVVTIFLFIWVCNMIGMIPIPGFMEPTRNLNVPLGMGIVCIVVVHATAIRAKGLWGHLEPFVNPIKNPMCVLDAVGEISKVVSISFRLFGNILGGAIIMLVISSLVKFILFPVGLNLFFGLFVGTIQAFVFTMLSLSYISVAVTEE
jgi:F-type H+-transporting ATPase subunit a